MTKLEKHFDEWAKSVNLFTKPELQQVMMKMSFYSGVLVMFGLMGDISYELDEDTAIKSLDDIDEELQEKMKFILEEIDNL